MAPSSVPAPVLLGFAGRMVGGGERLDHRTTKIGGVPDWPPVRAAAAANCDLGWSGSLGAAPPPPEMTVCARCGDTMALVAQAHAPLVSGELTGGNAVVDRVLYLLTCFNNKCPGANTNAGRWRCLRAQLPPVSAATLVHDAAAAATETHRPSTVPSSNNEGAAVGEVTDDWGGTGDDWGGNAGDDWGGDGDAAAGADALANALDALATRDMDGGTSKIHKDTSSVRFRDADGKDTGMDASSSAAAAAAASRKKWPGPALPEFYLTADYEPHASVASVLTSTEQADTERLLHKYAMDEGLQTNAGNAAAAIVSSITAQGAGGGKGNSGKQTNANAQEYAAEAYEPGSVDGVDGKYLKFAKRMRRAPDQCVRYGFGGVGLCWPVDGAGPESRCPKCENCGGARKAEVQLTPPLLLFAAQAKEWVTNDRRAPNDVTTESLDNWDWQTVVAMTCVNSCGPSAAVANSRSDGDETSADTFFWAEEVMETVDGDGGVAELLRSGQGDVPERDLVVQQ
jgi:pre-rRNA-processing protein TSR4|tara:strand:- start:356 stop:1891 length:1536 start_codon:yes stop_codon:yes gene_type:complete